MRLKRCLVAAGIVVSVAVSLEAREPNYDEASVGPYTLESPVVFANGTPLKSAAEWPKRRQEIVDIFAREMFGRIPPKPETLVTELVEEGPTLAGLGIRRQYKMWFRADKSGPCINWLVLLPVHATTPVPPILMLNYNGNHEYLDDKEVLLSDAWVRDNPAAGRKDHKVSAETRGVLRRSGNGSTVNAGEILSRGYGLMTACYGEVSPDPECRENPELFFKLAWSKVFDLWPDNDPKAGDNITAIGAWAWALSRGVDLAERIPELDARRSVATGYSRLGKTALLAASRDERFLVCIPNQTGGGGVPLAKRDYGENISTEHRMFPHWYCNNYWKYDDNEQAMPFDQHLLVASIAPRAILVEGYDSGWFDTKGEFLSCRAAGKAWEFLGQPGFPKGDFPPDFCEKFIAPRIGYVRRIGEHGFSAYDWKWSLNFIDKALAFRNDGSATVEPAVCRLKDPSDIVDPVFSWKMSSRRRGAAQAAYRLRVWKPGVKGCLVWDSGVVASDVSVGVAYAGAKLAPATRYRWSVEVKDERGTWLRPVAGEFVTGLAAADWMGTEWIAVPGQDVIVSNSLPKNPHAGIRTVPGTSCFVKKINVGGGVREAFWTVTGQGVFEAFVNGVRVGEDFLKPGFTHVFNRRHSFTYDLSDRIRGGNVVLAAAVSAGWWRDKIVHYRGQESAFRGQLVVRYHNGSEKRFGTDASWLGGIAGPVKQASIFEGERYDAREDMAWTKGTADARFAAVKTINEFKGEISPMEGPKIGLREDLALRPKTAYVWKDAEGADTNRFGKVKILRNYLQGEEIVIDAGEKLVIDFGQNAAAVPRFVASAAPGTEMTILPSEMLNDENGLKSRGNDGPEGDIYRVNLRDAYKNGCQVNYTFRGLGYEKYITRYSFFGYRYVGVTASGTVRIRSFESVPVTSLPKDLELGLLKTDVKDLNRLITNVKWGQYSNYLSVPTDCPQRNERLGWTADTQVFSEAASYNVDVYGFLSKWMGDERDSQHADGSYPSVAPVAQYGNEGHRLGWADAGVIVPYTMWKQFGDATIVRRNWESMERFLDMQDKTQYRTVTHPDGTPDGQYADWLSYENFEPCNGSAREKNPNGKGLRIKPDAVRYWNYLAGCYWLWDARMMRDMAAAIGKQEAVAKYEAMARRALRYVRDEFVDKADGMLYKPFRELQGAALFALKFGILERPEAVEATRQGLLKNIKDHGDCLTTGFLGTSILMDTLTYEAKSPDVAYTLLLQHKNPSWLYSVDQGATTIWERWNSYRKDTGFGPVGMNSFNHYAYGAVLAWMYGTMAGIREDVAQPGFKHVILAPVPDRRVGKVNAKYDSAYGVIRSAWEYAKDGTWTWRFTVPANVTATVILPNGRTEEVKAGSYERTVRN